MKLAERLAREAPHSLNESNRTLLLVRLFLSRSEISRVLRDNGFVLKRSWMRDGEREMLEKVLVDRGASDHESNAAECEDLCDDIEAILKE